MLVHKIKLQSSVDFIDLSCGFDVEDDMGGIQDTGDVDVGELAVGDGSDGCVEFFVFGEFVHYLEAVFALDSGGVRPRVKDGDVEVVFLEGLDDVDDLGVAHIGTVLLEGETEY